MYLADGKKKTLPKQLQKGLAMSFDKFDEYQFGKYKGNKKNVSLKDAVMLCHPKAPNDEKNALYRVKDGENALSFITNYYQPIPLVLRLLGRPS